MIGIMKSIPKELLEYKEVNKTSKMTLLTVREFLISWAVSPPDEMKKYGAKMKGKDLRHVVSPRNNLWRIVIGFTIRLFEASTFKGANKQVYELDHLKNPMG